MLVLVTKNAIAWFALIDKALTSLFSFHAFLYFSFAVYILSSLSPSLFCFWQWCAKFHSRRVKHILFGIDFKLDFSPLRNAVETFAQNNDTQIKQVGI